MFDVPSHSLCYICGPNILKINPRRRYTNSTKQQFDGLEIELAKVGNVIQLIFVKLYPIESETTVARARAGLVWAPGTQEIVRSNLSIITEENRIGTKELRFVMPPVELVNKNRSDEPPTDEPTEGPTDLGPTEGPIDGPTEGPTDGPTDGLVSLAELLNKNRSDKPPTDGPTDGPTEGPIDAPTDAPTEGPTDGPTDGLVCCCVFPSIRTVRGTWSSCETWFCGVFLQGRGTIPSRKCEVEL